MHRGWDGIYWLFMGVLALRHLVLIEWGGAVGWDGWDAARKLVSQPRGQATRTELRQQMVGGRDLGQAWHDHHAPLALVCIDCEAGKGRKNFTQEGCMHACVRYVHVYLEVWMCLLSDHAEGGDGIERRSRDIRC